MNYVSTNPLKRLLARSSPLLCLPYEVQIKMKQLRVFNSIQMYCSKMKSLRFCPDNFKKILESNTRGLPCPIDNILPSPVFNYRNKLGASVGVDYNGGVTVGHILKIYRKGCQNYVTLPFLAKEINSQTNLKIVEIFRDFITESAFKPKSKIFEDNVWSLLTVRSNRKDDVMVHLNFNGRYADANTLNQAKTELLDVLLPKLQSEVNIKSFYWQNNYFITNPSESKFPSELLWGDPCLYETMCNKTFSYGPRAFFQVNTVVAEKMYKTVRELIVNKIQIGKKTLLLDLCCGIGIQGIIMADTVDKVIGVDNNVTAIKNAKANAELNGVTNTEYFCKDVEEYMADAVKSESFKEYDNIIAFVNPGRRGLNKRFCCKLRCFEKLRNVIYVACHFEKSISNMIHLSTDSRSYRHGSPFEMERVIPFDMFPHTKLVELLVLLKR